jgi:hypothetical protein
MIETFNAKVRAECLDQQWFESLEEAKNNSKSGEKSIIGSVHTAP